MKFTINNYLSSLLTLNLNKNQIDYFRWQYNQQKIVKIKSYKENKELNLIIKDFLLDYSPKQKGCYDTAWKCCAHDINIQYIEGYISYHGLPIEHAWNCYKNNFYFDLTSEVLFDSTMGDEHVQIIKIDQKLMFKYLSKNKISGNLMKSFYIDKILSTFVKGKITNHEIH